MSSSNERMSVEDGTDDALEKFQELFGTIMEAPPQSNEEDPYAYDPFNFTQLPETEGETY
jgi:hypothetical protein